MNSVLLHLLILWAVIAVVLGAIYGSRRGGVEFAGLKYAGIFGFVGAAFGVVIGMTTFFASQHYADVRQAAEHEATALGDVSALSGSYAPREGALLRQQLYSYATAVIDHEWSRTNGEGAQPVDERQAAGYFLMLRIGRQNPEPETWYSDAMRSALDTGEQREQRLLLSQPQIPVSLWFLLYVGAALIILFAFFFHLEKRTQLIGMILAVSLMLSAVVAVLSGLDSPTQGPFGLKPTAMEAERALIVQDVDTGGQSPTAFCASLPLPQGTRTSLR
jgi:Protein of unknown function (DUF4239)